MFRVHRTRTPLQSAIYTCELIFHTAVRSIRSVHSNAVVALLYSILHIVVFVGVFYLFFQVLGLRSIALRGDFLVFLMTGVFLFLTFNKSLSAVTSAEGPTSAMMQHGPMNTAISIAAAMLGILYIQILSVFLVFFVYDVAFKPNELREVFDPIGCLAMLLLAWFAGSAIGLVFLAIKPWAPKLIGIVETVFTRFNMIASGKMLVVNSLPGYLLPYFDWNPLFHVIDQSRGYAFLNYSPRYTSWEYALYVGIACIVLGMLGEFYTRKHMSASWTAGK